MKKFKKGDKAIVVAKGSRMADYYADLLCAVGDGGLSEAAYRKLFYALITTQHVTITKALSDGYECAVKKVAFPYLILEKDLKHVQA